MGEMHMMIKIRTLILTLLCLAISSITLAATNVGAILPATSAGTVSLDFYAINDFRGRVVEDGEAPGGARLVGIMRSLARQNIFGTVFLGGSNMLYGYAPSDKLSGTPAQIAVNSMGITANVVNADTFVTSPARATGYGFITLGANVFGCFR
jgi:hypothetical protein